ARRVSGADRLAAQVEVALALAAMRAKSLRFTADDGKELHVHQFLPDDAPIGVVHVSHGMAEHAGRYARMAAALTKAGYAVFANDHRGHGQTATSDDELGFFASTGGFDRIVRDAEEIVAFEKREVPPLSRPSASHRARSRCLAHGPVHPM